MEDALARNNKKKSGRRSKVLILVVMEDALAPFQAARISLFIGKS